MNKLKSPARPNWIAQLTFKPPFLFGFATTLESHTEKFSIEQKEDRWSRKHGSFSFHGRFAIIVAAPEPHYILAHAQSIRFRHILRRRSRRVEFWNYSIAYTITVEEFQIMKVTCKCGHLIREEDSSACGTILKDQDFETFWNEVCEGVAEFTEAVSTGKKEEWINRHFLPSYPRNLNHTDVISDFLSGLHRKYRVEIRECENCGRVWIEDEVKANALTSFTPESGLPERVLASSKSYGS